MTHSSRAEVELTPRRREVLELLARGLSSAEIAARLHRSIRTVESHRYALNKQFGTRNSVELVRRAIELRLVEADPMAAADDGGAAVVTAADQRLLQVAALLSTMSPGATTLELACVHLGCALEAERVAVLTIRPGEPPSRVVAWSRRPGDDGWPSLDDEQDRQRLLDGVGWSRRIRDGEGAGGGAEPASAGAGEDEADDQAAERFLTAVPLRTAASTPRAALLIEHSRPLPGGRTFTDALRAIAGRMAADCAVADLESREGWLREASAVLQRKAGVATLTLLASRNVLRLGARARDLLGVDRRELTLEELAGLDRGDGRRTVIEPVREAVAAGREFLLRLELGPPAWSAEATSRILMVRGQPAERCPINGLVHLCFAVPLDQTDGPSVALPFATLAAQFVERCPDPLVVADVGGRIVVANTAWRSLGGPSEAGAADSRCGDVTELGRCLGDETAARVVAAIDRVAGGRPPSRVQVAIAADAAPTRIEAIEVEPVVGMPLAFVRLRPAAASVDPSTPAVAVVDRRPPGAMPDLPRSSLFDWVFDESLVPMALCDMEGRAIRANRAFRDTLGRTEANVASMPWIELVAERDHERAREQLSRLMAGEGITQIPIVMRHADGSERILEWSATPPLPGTSVFMGIGVDVTEQVVAGSMMASAFSRFPLGSKGVGWAAGVHGAAARL